LFCFDFEKSVDLAPFFYFFFKRVIFYILFPRVMKNRKFNLMNWQLQVNGLHLYIQLSKSCKLDKILLNDLSAHNITTSLVNCIVLQLYGINLRIFLTYKLNVELRTKEEKGRKRFLRRSLCKTLLPWNYPIYKHQLLYCLLNFLLKICIQWNPKRVSNIK